MVVPNVLKTYIRLKIDLIAYYLLLMKAISDRQVSSRDGPQAQVTKWLMDRLRNCNQEQWKT